MAEYVQAAMVRWSTTWQIPKKVRMLLIDKVTGRSIADADAVIQRTVDIAAVRRMRDGSTALRPEDVEQGARSVLVD